MNKLFFSIILGLGFSVNAMIEENQYDIYSFFGLEKKLVAELKQLPIELQSQIAQQKINHNEWWYNSATFIHEYDTVQSAMFNQKGDRVLINSFEKTAKLWDLDGKLIATFRHDDYIQTAVFDQECNRVLTVSATQANLWDLNGNLLASVKHDNYVHYPIFNKKGDRILADSWDKTAKLWDLDGKLITTFRHDDYVRTAVFDQDGNRVLTASADKTAKLWDLEGNLLATFRHPHPCSVDCAIFNQQGDRVLTVSSRGVSVWDLNSTLLATFRCNDLSFRCDMLYCLIFNHLRFDQQEGDRVLMASRDGTANLWDLNNAKDDSNATPLIRPSIFPGKLFATFRHGEGKEINSAVFNQSANRVLTASQDGTAKLWDLNAKLIVTFWHEGSVKTAVFNRKGDSVLTASADKTVKLWKLYKYPTIEQILFKKLIGLYLTSKKSSKNITNIEYLLKSISIEFNLKFEELESIWERFSEDVRKSLWFSIEKFIARFGK